MTSLVAQRQDRTDVARRRAGQHTAEDTMTIELAAGGGFIARFDPK